MTYHAKRFLTATLQRFAILYAVLLLIFAGAMTMDGGHEPHEWFGMVLAVTGFSFLVAWVFEGLLS